MATSSQLALDIAVSGATLGDIVMVSFNQPLQGMILSASVKSDDTVEVVLYNPGSNSVVDMASGVFRISVIQH
eukprot:scaffold682699_cov69-Prasinocladus_malaysianus.AAC.1